MKSNKLFLFFALFCCSFGAFAQSLNIPAASPSQTVKQSFGTSEISVEYSRPSANGRAVFGNVVNYDNIWRTGANASSKITFGSDVKVQGKDVKAGTYAIYTIPTKGEWDVMLYKDLTLGGNVAKYNAENEVTRFKVKPTELKDKVETFTINFDGFTPTATTLVMSWENTKIAIGITTDIDATIMKNIDKFIVNDNRPFSAAANYYLENNKDMKLAMEWINKAISNNPKGYWLYMTKAKIASKQNDKAAAIAAANECNKLATESNDDSYIKQSKEFLKELGK